MVLSFFLFNTYNHTPYQFKVFLMIFFSYDNDTGLNKILSNFTFLHLLSFSLVTLAVQAVI